MTGTPRMLFDVECYPNFFLVVLKNVETGEFVRFQKSPSTELKTDRLMMYLQYYQLIGFNSIAYDVPMIQLALQGATTEQLKQANDEIIKYDMNFRDFNEKYNLSRPSWDHIDLIQVAPLKASLKIYAGRLHCTRMQDLPIDPDAIITSDQAAAIYHYCCNDLNNTAMLLDELAPQIALREDITCQYHEDVRSKSDAQVAEKIIGAEIKKINGEYPRRPTLAYSSYRYTVPEFVSFSLPQLQGVLEKIRGAEFEVNGNGATVMPPELENTSIRINGSTYRIGIGGLHSSEHSVMHLADEETLLIDRDVTSYYPSIILNQGLYPQHLGKAFLDVYRTIVERRVAAKKMISVTKSRLNELKKMLQEIENGSKS